MAMPRTFLVVDDEPAIRAYVKGILQTETFHGLEAESAPAAFRLIQKLNGSLDLVVTDVNMPGDMDGLDLAYAIRDAFPLVPVIVISGYASEGSAKRPIGEFVFIEKPFQPDAILRAVRKATAPPQRLPAAS